MALTLFVLCLGQTWTVAVVRADDNDLVEDPRLAPRADEPNEDRRHLSADIDNWIFGVDPSETRGAEKCLRSQLQMRVDVLAQMMSLSKDQIEQLSLAGQGDIRRFLNRVDELKTRLAVVVLRPNSWQEIYQACRPFQDDFRRGVFAEPSLFAKTLSRIKAIKQIEQSKKGVRDRRRFQHQAGVNMTVLRLSTALGLNDGQQTRLKELLLRETRPARTLDGATPDGYLNVVYAQLPRIPEQKLRPLFEPGQWRALKTKLSLATDFAANLDLADADEDDGRR